jgi:hypothetical protein
VTAADWHGHGLENGSRAENQAPGSQWVNLSALAPLRMREVENPRNLRPQKSAFPLSSFIGDIDEAADFFRRRIAIEDPRCVRGLIDHGIAARIQQPKQLLEKLVNH